jgi:hypothetical protein
VLAVEGAEAGQRGRASLALGELNPDLVGGHERLDLLLHRGREPDRQQLGVEPGLRRCLVEQVLPRRRQLVVLGIAVAVVLGIEAVVGGLRDGQVLRGERRPGGGRKHRHAAG